MKKILFVLTSHNEKGNTGQKTGYYLSEAAHPWEVLNAAGYVIDFVSPQGGMPPVDGFDMSDTISKRFWENKDVQQKLQNTLTPKQVNPVDYVAIHYVGGHGTMWDFPGNEVLARVASEIYENGGIVSAVCHGPAGLINVKLSNGEYLVKGKTVAAFTNAEEEAVGLTKVVPFLLQDELVKRGAKHVSAPNWQSNVQVSERLVTGQNPASATNVGREVLKLLEEHSYKPKEILREEVSLPVTGQPAMDAYMTRPADQGQYPAVIVGMELFGVTQHIKSIADRLAARGYIVLVPNFYHRSKLGVALSSDDAGKKKGFELLHQVTRNDAVIDVRAAMDFLKNQAGFRGNIGFLGFSVGGHIGYLASTQLNIKAAACFYAGWLTNSDIELSQPEPTLSLTHGIAKHGGRIIFFAGDKDFLVTTTQLNEIENALKKSNVKHEMVIYPNVQHGFFCDERETYDRAARDDAWDRVLKLFAQELTISKN